MNEPRFPAEPPPPDPGLHGAIQHMIGARTVWSDLFIPALAAVLAFSLATVFISSINGPAGEDEEVGESFEAYRTPIAPIEVEPELLALSTSLLFASFGVSSASDGASVWVDGSRLGSTPLSDMSMRPGLRSVRVTRGQQLLLDTLVVLRAGSSLVLDVPNRPVRIARVQQDPVGLAESTPDSEVDSPTSLPSPVESASIAERIGWAPAGRQQASEQHAQNRPRSDRVGW